MIKYIHVYELVGDRRIHMHPYLCDGPLGRRQRHRRHGHKDSEHRGRHRVRNLLFRQDQRLSYDDEDEDYDDFTLLWVNDFDPETKINTAGLTLFALTEEGLYERFDGELVEKYYPPEFFTAAGEKAGLVLLAVYGELKDNDPSEDEERIFYVFRKEGGN